MYIKLKVLLSLLVLSVFNSEAKLDYKTFDLQTKQLNATLYIPELLTRNLYRDDIMSYEI